MASLQSSDGSCTNERPALALHPVYQDFAHMDIPSVLKQLAMDEKELENRVHMGRKEIFPVRLHTALEGCSTSPTLFAVMRWLPHGRAFKIYDKRRFIDEVLPQYFHGQRVYGSFQRQLNMYGLLKLTGEHSDHGAYYHPLLLRGRPLLCHLLVRRYEAESTVRRGYDPRSEPNFYRMPPMRNATVGPNHSAAHSATTLCNTQRNGTEAVVAYGINNATAMSRYVPAQRRDEYVTGIDTTTLDEPNVTPALAIGLLHHEACASSYTGHQLQSNGLLAPKATTSTASPVDIRLHFMGPSPFIQATAALPPLVAVCTSQPTDNRKNASDDESLALAPYDKSDGAASCTPHKSAYPIEYLEPYRHFTNVQVSDEWQGGDVKPSAIGAQLGVDQTARNSSLTSYGWVREHESAQTYVDCKRSTSLTAESTTMASGIASETSTSGSNHSGAIPCLFPILEVDNIGIVMSVEDATAACDRDEYQALFSST